MAVLVNESNMLVGIYFHDVKMKQIYPELICVNATYKLLDLHFPVYIVLVDGQSEIVVVHKRDRALHQMYGWCFQKAQSTVGSHVCVGG